MLRLRTFGAVFVERDGEALRGAASQRRVLALLAVLAVARDEGVSRDRVLGLLWPESEPEKARQSLAQALYHARRALGQDDLFFAAADLRLNRDVFTSDVGEFEEALHRGELERAVSLYSGPFLKGFYVGGASEFERWASLERARLADRCGQALERLAVAAEAAADYRRAIEWRKQLAALDPLNSRVAMELMLAMAAAGDRAGAIQHARVHELLLRQELDVAPDTALTELVERLRDESLWRAVPSGTLAAAAPGLAPDAGARESTVAPDSEVAREAPPHVGEETGLGTTVAARDGSSDSSHLNAAPASQPADPATVEIAPTPVDDRPTALLRARPSVPWLTRRAVLLASALGIALMAAVILAIRWRRAPVAGAAPVKDMVVVAPFRVAGADPSLAYLREGLVDLLVTKLTDEDATLAADPGSVLSAWRRAGLLQKADVPRAQALEMARQLAAERLLTGSVVGTPSRLVITASVVGVPGGELRAQATVEGPADSLNTLVDRLATRLLAREAGAWDRLASHTSTSLPALRAYLDGQSAYRRGGYRDAVRYFSRALQLDSTFAMAGLGLAQAAERIDARAERARGLAAAWAARNELTERDRAYLDALAGPRYPAHSSEREQLAAWERAAAATPGRADIWHELGERFFYDGQLLGIRNWRERAVAAFERAAELDRQFASPLQYLVQLAAHAGDTARVREIAAQYLQLDSAGDLSAFVRWRAAVALSDSAELGELRRQFASVPPASLQFIALSAHSQPIEGRDAERALSVMLSRAVRAAERLEVHLGRHAVALNRGRPGDALEVTEDIEDLQPLSRLAARLRVIDAMYGEGDSAAAARSVPRLSGADVLPRAAARDEDRLIDVCIAEQWRVWYGELRTARQVIDILTAGADGVPADSSTTVCTALLEAIVSVRGRHPDGRDKVERLDSLSMFGLVPRDMRSYINLALARLHEARGETTRALEAVRRRPHMQPWPHYLAPALRMEGQLAALTGDTAAAIRAYRHFLALRPDPEARAVPATTLTRSELARLTAGLK